MQSRRRYQLAKVGTVALTGVTSLLGLTGVLSLYSERYLVGSLVVVLYLGLLMFDTVLYLWILEQMTKGKTSG
jgi:protein-S-isoprenylcysteine O-methyltransferase Ste14